MNKKRQSSSSINSSMRVPSKFEADPDLSTLFQKYKFVQDTRNVLIAFGSMYKDIADKGIYLFKDERLAASCDELPKYSDVMNPSSVYITNDVFKKFIQLSRTLLMSIFHDQLIIPKFTNFRYKMEFLYEACKFTKDGEPSTLVPHLKKLNPDIWQVSLCSNDGQIYQSELENMEPFPMMGICKPFLYILSVTLLGSDVVHGSVGLQTSRKSLLEKEIIPKTERFQNRPLNVTMESGAIVLCSLIINVGLKDLPNASKYDYIYNFFKKMAGRGYVGSDKSILMSMQDNSDEYLALCYYLESCKCFRWKHDIKKDLEFYFQICSFEVNCESLSIIGATIANNGVNPFTGQQILSKNNCKQLYSFMQIFSAGPSTALWIRKISLPIAFGESGGCLLVLPGLMAVGLLSPKLNKYCISLKAYLFIKCLSKQFTIHPFSCYEQKDDTDNNGSCPNACPLFKAAQESSFYRMAEAVQQGFNLCTRNYVGKTILHYAAAAGKTECVKFLVKLCPALIRMEDLLERTASKDAALFKHKEIEHFLIMEENKEKGSQIILTYSS